MSAAAGLYELTPAKRACLRRCRERIGDDDAPAVLAGLHYGHHCAGCCAGLMLFLFAVGVMNVYWMMVVSLLVFVQKVQSVVLKTVTPAALALIRLGIWIAVAPSSAPLPTLPM